MLLVAVDIEGCAWNLVAEAAMLARDLGVDVHLTTAVDVPVGVAPHAHLHGEFEGKEMVEVLLEDSTRSLKELSQPFEDLGVTVETSVRAGPVVASICAFATRLKPRYLVLGTHGRTGIKRLVLGSVAEQILRQSPVPVFVVPSHETTMHPHPALDRLRFEADG